MRKLIVGGVFASAALASPAVAFAGDSGSPVLGACGIPGRTIQTIAVLDGPAAGPNLQGTWLRPDGDPNAPGQTLTYRCLGGI